jgi:TonB family protein
MPSQGNDRIDTAAMARDPGLGAQMQGEASFEAVGTDAGAYVKVVKEKIWKAWFPYVMSNYPKDFKEANAVVSFVLDPNGDLKAVNIIQSQGSPVFAAFCVEAVQSAAPFGPPPKEALQIWGRDEIEIKFGFHYR